MCQLQLMHSSFCVGLLLSFQQIYLIQAQVKVYLLIYLSKYLDHEATKESFGSSSQAVTCYYQSNHSKVEAIPISALPKDTTRALAGLSPH